MLDAQQFYYSTTITITTTTTTTTTLNSLPSTSISSLLSSIFSFHRFLGSCWCYLCIASLILTPLENGAYVQMCMFVYFTGVSK